MPNQPSDLRSFIAMARSEDYLILDTETTGLRKPAEIVEVSICNNYGIPLFDQLIKPKGPYGPEAQRITGITPDMLYGSGYWRDYREYIMGLTKGRNVVVWNAVFDRQMFHLSDESNLIGHFDWSDHCNWFCAMTAYGEFNGVWDDYHQNYKWWKLVEAHKLLGFGEMTAHRATADCIMTCNVVHKMLVELEDVDLEHIGEHTDTPFKAVDITLADLPLIDPDPDLL